MKINKNTTQRIPIRLGDISMKWISFLQVPNLSNKDASSLYFLIKGGFVS